MDSQALSQHLIQGGCRCDNEADHYKKICGWKNTPPLCAHRIALDAINEMHDIEQKALRAIATLPNTPISGGTSAA